MSEQQDGTQFDLFFRACGDALAQDNSISTDILKQRLAGEKLRRVPEFFLLYRSWSLVELAVSTRPWTSSAFSDIFSPACEEKLVLDLSSDLLRRLSTEKIPPTTGRSRAPDIQARVHILQILKAKEFEQAHDLGVEILCLEDARKNLHNLTRNPR